MDPTPKPAGVDVQVNINTAGNKLQPCVTALSDGGFVLTWQSRGQNGSGWGIHARRYDSNGVEVGEKFQVDTSTFECEGPASVTALSDGGFIVAWPSGGGLASGSQVYGQRFGSDGVAVGSASRINSDATGNHFYVAVSGFSDGGYLATWTSDSEDGLFNVYGQRYRADGTAIGVEFRINTYTTGDQVLSALATMADGGFVATWTSSWQDGGGSDIYGQRFAPAGAPVGSEFRVNTHTGQHWSSSPAALLDGGFVVTWTSSEQDGSSDGIYGQRYGADGAAIGTEFRINTYSDDRQTYSSVTALSDGGFVVTWTSQGQDGSGNGIYGQRFTADALPAGEEFRVNDITDGNQFARTSNGYETLATLASGRLVQVWLGRGGTEEIFFRLIDVPAPAFTSGLTGSIAENASTSLVVYDADATSDGPITYSLSGVDRELFAIDPENGQVRFLASPNFEAPTDKGADNVYDVVVHARDGLIEATRPVAITVTDQNDNAPAIMTKAALSVAENTLIVAALTSTDPDTVGTAPAEFSIAGGTDAGLFAVTDGTLVFRKAPDFETDPHSYQVEVTASDGVNHSAELLTVTLTDLDDVIKAGDVGGPFDRLGALKDAYIVLQGTSQLSVNAQSGVLFNDRQMSAGTAGLVTVPGHGSVELNADGSFVYSSVNGFAGIDSFSYKATSTGGALDHAEALVYVVPVIVGPTTTTLDLFSLSREEQLAATYVSFLGRAADRDGFDFWVKQFIAHETTANPADLLAGISNSFGVGDEAKGVYSFLANPHGASDAQIASFLDSVYLNLFDRTAEEAGRAYWSNEIKETLDAGRSVGSVLMNIVGGAQDTATGLDITTLMSKVAVNLEYVHAQREAGNAWTPADDQPRAVGLLDPVAADPQSVLIGVVNAYSIVAADVI